MNEGATADADSEHPLLIGDRQGVGPARGSGRRGRRRSADRAPAAPSTALGEITIETEGIGRREAATISPVYDTPAAFDEDAVFASSDTFQLTVTPVQDADSLNDEFTLRLRSTESISTGRIYNGGRSSTTTRWGPRRSATPTSRIFEGTSIGAERRSSRRPAAGICPRRFPTRGQRGYCPGGDARRLRPTLQLARQTEGESARFCSCGSGRRPRRCDYRPWIRGEVTIDKDHRGLRGGRRSCDSRRAATCRISGIPNSRWRSRNRRCRRSAGRIAAGPPAVIQVLNDDPLPSCIPGEPPNSAIDEGMTQTVAIAAEGALAGAVMRVGVRVTGDALLSLLQDGRRLRANARRNPTPSGPGRQRIRAD